MMERPSDDNRALWRDPAVRRSVVAPPVSREAALRAIAECRRILAEKQRRPRRAA